jgi:hypothetical protein
MGMSFKDETHSLIADSISGLQQFCVMGRKLFFLSAFIDATKADIIYLL